MPTRRRLQGPSHSAPANAAMMQVLDSQLRDNDPPETRATLELLLGEGVSVDKSTSQLLVLPSSFASPDTQLRLQVFPVQQRLAAGSDSLTNAPKPTAQSCARDELGACR
jgi:hypothetical protein